MKTYNTTYRVHATILPGDAAKEDAGWCIAIRGPGRSCMRTDPTGAMAQIRELVGALFTINVAAFMLGEPPVMSKRDEAWICRAALALAEDE